MNDSNGTGRAVVIGASMAGLLAAKAAASHFGEVVVIERDQLPTGSAHRRCVPQGHHAHGLLSGGRAAIEALLPGFVARAQAGGAMPGDFSQDCLIWAGGGYHRRFHGDLPAMLISRCLIEATVRDIVMTDPAIRVLQRSRVLELIWSADRRTVTGVRWAPSDDGALALELAADLVVDAGGRGSRLPGWLAAHGWPTPREEVIRSDVVYATREFERRPGDLPQDAKVLLLTAEPPQARGGAMLAIEGDRWIATLFGLAGERPEASETGFLAFARTLAVPEFARIAEHARPVSEVHGYRIEGSRRRHFEELDGFPAGLLPIGDAICSFNPIFGQGMTVAAMQALALRGLLADGRHELARRYFARTRELVDAPWQIAAGADLRFPAVQGPRPLAVRLVNRYLERLHYAAHDDTVVAGAFHRVLNLVDPPAAILAPQVAWHVMRARRAGAKATPGRWHPARPAA